MATNIWHVRIWLFNSSKAVTELWEIKEALEDTGQMKFLILKLWKFLFSPHQQPGITERNDKQYHHLEGDELYQFCLKI